MRRPVPPKPGSKPAGKGGSLAERAATSWLVRLLVTVAILGYLASKIDMADAARAVVAVHPGTAAVLAGRPRSRGDDSPMGLAAPRQRRPHRHRPGRVVFLVKLVVGSFLPAGVGGTRRAPGASR